MMIKDASKEKDINQSKLIHADEQFKSSCAVDSYTFLLLLYRLSTKR